MYWFPLLSVAALHTHYQFLESRMTPNGQIIADNGTLICVPNPSKPAPHMPMNNPGGLRAGPLHAMQNMRSALSADPMMPGSAAALASASPKKKRAPQGDKKKKAKVMMRYICINGKLDLILLEYFLWLAKPHTIMLVLCLLRNPHHSLFS